MDIKSLKDKILQLAIQGKLVSQDENDEPASVLLEKIKAEKEQLIKDKVIKKEKPLPEISEEEKVFDLPKGWEWCRLGDIIKLISGRDLNNSICNNEGIGIPYIMGASNMSKDGLVIERWTESPTVIGLKNDIIISVKGTVGKLDIIDLEKVHLSRQVMSMRCYSGLIFNKYILLYLQSYIERIKEKSSGVIPGISRDNLLQILVAVPPLEEQKHIVKKVDELFELIDELDNNKQELLENISNTRNKVLRLAIQGKLVEQCEDDEPASVLLERIKEEKEQLIKDKVIKKEKPLPEITEEEKIFNIPENWSVVRLGSVINLISGQDFKPNQYNDCNKGIPYITGASSLSNNGVIINRWTEEPRSFARNGDVLLVCKGSGYGTTVICDVDTAHIARQIMAIKSSAFLNMHYVRYFLKANINYIKKSGQGLIPGIDRKSIQEMIFPLPPLKEQNRIVDKVDSIMDYLEKLQKEIELQEIILEDIM